MTSLQGAIHAVAAADTTPTVGFVALVADGAAGILGSDTQPIAPHGAAGRPRALWAYLGLPGETPSLAPNAVDGIFRWWLYDDAQWGYLRLNAAAGRLLALYPEKTGHLYRDPVTLETIWWQGPGFVGPQLAAEEYGQLLRWVDFPYRKTHRGMTLAA